MAENVALGPLNTANIQRTTGDKSIAIKQVERSLEIATKNAIDTSIDRGVEVLISDRPTASVDPTYENLGSSTRRGN